MSYLHYIKVKNPVKMLSNIFRSYRRGSDLEIRKSAMKKNQSEPWIVLGKKAPLESTDMDAIQSLTPKEATDNANKLTSQTSGENFRSTSSDVGMKKPSSAISLGRKSSYLDLSLSDKLAQIPLRGLEKRSVIRAKHACPWRNDNFGKRPEYHLVKQVNNISAELLNRKSSLKRQKIQLDGKAIKQMMNDIKFNRHASLMVYSRPSTSGTMKQARINMSTNCNVRHRIGSNDLFMKQNRPAAMTCTAAKAVNMSTNKIIRHRVGDSSIFPKKIENLQETMPIIALRRKRRLAEDSYNGHFWYTAKKPRIC